MLNRIYEALDPVALTIGPFSIRWYGIAYLLGFVCAAVIIYRTAKRWKIPFNSDSLLTVILGIIIGVIIGARLGYVIFYGNGYYFQHPLAIFALNEGGMSFHGGMAGALISGIFTSRLTRLPFLTLADLGSIGAPLGLFFGRCANFVNGELWGSASDLPWAVVFGGQAGEVARHPSQLYEALLEGVVLFAILYILSRRFPPRPRGTFIGLFLLLYGIFRFALEFIREPDAQLGYLWSGWLTMGQVLSLPVIIAGIALLFYAFFARKEQGLIASAR